MKLPSSFVLEATLTDGSRRLLTKGHALQIPGGDFLIIWAYSIFPGEPQKVPSAWSKMGQQLENELQHIDANHYSLPKPIFWENLDDLLPTQIGQN